jgi:hypothetical protein
MRVIPYERAHNTFLKRVVRIMVCRPEQIYDKRKSWWVDYSEKRTA